MGEANKIRLKLAQGKKRGVGKNMYGKYFQKTKKQKYFCLREKNHPLQEG